RNDARPRPARAHAHGAPRRPADGWSSLSRRDGARRAMTVTVLHEPATNGPAIATFVCAHGASGNMHDRGMQAVANELRGRGLDVDGLLLLAYPLHPVGKPEQLRDAHLPRITMPALCLNGTRDALCRRDFMDAVVPRLGANFQMHWLEGADHSFHVLKSSGRTDADVMSEIGGATYRWLQKISNT